MMFNKVDTVTKLNYIGMIISAIGIVGLIIGLVIDNELLVDTICPFVVFVPLIILCVVNTIKQYRNKNGL